MGSSEGSARRVVIGGSPWELQPTGRGRKVLLVIGDQGRCLGV